MPRRHRCKRPDCFGGPVELAVIRASSFEFALLKPRIGLFFLRQQAIMPFVGRVGTRPGKITTVTATSALWPPLVHLL
jgi:hypothetical protein